MALRFKKGTDGANQLEEYARAYGQACAQAAIDQERERCAQICDALYSEEQLEPVCYGFCKECADAIRKQN